MHLEKQVFLCTFAVRKNAEIMRTVLIEDSTPQAMQLLNYIGTLPFATVVEENKKSFMQAAKECNAISVKEFFDEVRRQVNEQYDSHA